MPASTAGGPGCHRHGGRGERGTEQAGEGGGQALRTRERAPPPSREGGAVEPRADGRLLRTQED
eukprot:15353700-Alexandrium_andersonii.AAC.1